MQRKTLLPELLAPAGSYEALLAAIEAGADAVYLGGKCFNARAYATNFDEEALSRAVQYAHLHNVKIYVTLNTLLYDKELSSFLDYAGFLYKTGVDAVIVADLGAISLLRKELPDLELHASTQATAHSSLGADELYNMGISRVVLSRELSLENIKRTTELCSAETEIFLHGALCVCHSGQCLFSSLVGERSGNRGECAQPCRLPYNNSYPLSLKDLSLASHIPALIESGVASLKIEGRMKSPEYVYGVTSIYRRLLDERRNATEKEMQMLASLFSRNGFTDGYFTGKTERGMLGVRSDEDKEKTRGLEKKTFAEKKLKIKAKCLARANQPASLSLIYENKEISVEGVTPEPAKSAPLTEEGVRAQLSKMGNTFFSLDKDDIALTLDEGLNLPVSALNQLRRTAAEKLTELLSKKQESKIPESVKRAKPAARLSSLKTALCFKFEQYEEVRNHSFDIIYLPITEFKENETNPNGVYIPPVITENELDTVLRLLERAKGLGATYALIGNISHFALAEKAGLIPTGDYRLNVMNERAKEVYRDMGAIRCILSPELTLPQMRDIKADPIVYGRIPLMLLERCYMKENFGCKKCGACQITDRKGVKFPLLREFEHRNLLLNSSVTYMGDKKEQLLSYGIKGVHFIFTVETKEECKKVLFAYEKGAPYPFNHVIRRIKK